MTLIGHVFTRQASPVDKADLRHGNFSFDKNRFWITLKISLHGHIFQIYFRQILKSLQGSEEISAVNWASPASHVSIAPYFWGFVLVGFTLPLYKWWSCIGSIACITLIELNLMHWFYFFIMTLNGLKCFVKHDSRYVSHFLVQVKTLVICNAYNAQASVKKGKLLPPHFLGNGAVAPRPWAYRKGVRHSHVPFFQIMPAKQRLCKKTS